MNAETSRAWADFRALRPEFGFTPEDLDQEHPYLADRGFTAETIAQFGLGFCNRGMFRGRIAFPIRDERGELVAYAGRVVDDRAITETNLKYKLASAREQNRKPQEFDKSALAYNLSEIPNKVSDIIVVQGFPSVWWLWQHGYCTTVSLMGNDCSPEQAKLILCRVEIDGRIWIMPDGDEAGILCGRSCWEQLAPFRFCRWARLRKGEQPTNCGPDELATLLSYKEN